MVLVIRSNINVSGWCEFESRSGAVFASATNSVITTISIIVNTVGSSPFESIVHQTTVASGVDIVAINQFLFRKSSKRAILFRISVFHSGDGRESPA